MNFDLEDMREFADKHRGKYKTSGPHWPLVIRFPVLFDEYEKILGETKKANLNNHNVLNEIIEHLRRDHAFVESNEYWGESREFRKGYLSAIENIIVRIESYTGDVLK